MKVRNSLMSKVCLDLLIVLAELDKLSSDDLPFNPSVMQAFLAFIISSMRNSTHSVFLASMAVCKMFLQIESAFIQRGIPHKSITYFEGLL